jgi:hypothetical protein
MDPALTSQSTTTTTAPPLADVEHIELQVLTAASSTTTAPPSRNADPEDPDMEENEVDASFPLGVKLTTYRLLNVVIILAFGLAKFMLSLKGQNIAPVGLDWVAGSVFAAL